MSSGRPDLLVTPSACSWRAVSVPDLVSTKTSNTRRTRAASASFTTSFRLATSYPSGTLPPIHMSRAFDAAPLSRMRSPIAELLLAYDAAHGDCASRLAAMRRLKRAPEPLQ